MTHDPCPHAPMPRHPQSPSLTQSLLALSLPVPPSPITRTLHRSVYRSRPHLFHRGRSSFRVLLHHLYQLRTRRTCTQEVQRRKHQLIKLACGTSEGREDTRA